MKTKLSLIIFIIGIMNLFTIRDMTAQSWTMAKHCGGKGPDQGYGMVMDTSGNIYFTGTIKDDAYFDSIHLWCGYPGVCFLAKYDHELNPIWVKIGRGGYFPFYNVGTGLCLDNDENVIWAGQYSGTSVFNQFTIQPLGGDYDLYIAKYDKNGNCMWITTVGGGGYEEINAVTYDGSDHFYITGSINYPCAFDTITVNNTNGKFIPFVAKYSTSGNCEWVYTPSCSQDSYGTGVVFKDNSLYFSGDFSGDLSIGQHQFSADSNNAIFLAVLNTDGQPLSATAAVGTGDFSSYDIAAAPNGDCYITGLFSGSVVINSDTLQNETDWDIFIVKANHEAQFLWGKQGNTSQGSNNSLLSTKGKGLTVCDNGDLLVTGTFSGSIHFDGFTLTPASALRDVFVAKFDSNGYCLGLNQGINGHGEVVNLAPDKTIVVCGTMYDDTAVFGSQSLVSYGDDDVFVAKMNNFTGEETISSAGSNGLLIYANPNKGICNIEIPEEFKNDQNLTLLIYNNLGQLTGSFLLDISNDRIGIDISAQAEGIYHAVLTNGVKRYNGKIVFAK